MHWKHKALIESTCARLPLGARLYKLGQRVFGDLRAQPERRLVAQIEMARWLAQYGLPVANSRLVEVGTGHIPVVPIGFYLAGAQSTVTVDINRRIDWALTRDTLEWIAAHREKLQKLYACDATQSATFEQRFEILVASKANPKRFLEQAGIEYLAPKDAAKTGLPAGSVHCHYSMTVLEHIPEAALCDILAEAGRILAPGGVALHFIDTSDHFQHQDRSIERINFLRYSEDEWRRLAGNQFGYCNRMRASDLLRLASGVGLIAVRTEIDVDERSKQAVTAGFPLAERFARYERDDLCATELRVMWRYGGRESGLQTA